MEKYLKLGIWKFQKTQILTYVNTFIKFEYLSVVSEIIKLYIVVGFFKCLKAGNDLSSLCHKWGKTDADTERLI